jgi:Phosphotransferase system mannitol/fructose-specific IIA domain (Ntr-type)
MNLSDILDPDRVAVGVQASSKKRVLEELARRLTTGVPGLASADVLASLATREKLGSTGLGHGIAIPHGRVSGIERSIGACLRLAFPIDYDAHDSEPVDVVFGLLVPQNATGEHLRHLAAIAERFADDGFCAEARAAAGDAALYALLTR